jgi:hypothetical protein
MVSGIPPVGITQNELFLVVTVFCWVCDMSIGPCVRSSTYHLFIKYLSIHLAAYPSIHPFIHPSLPISLYIYIYNIYYIYLYPFILSLLFSLSTSLSTHQSTSVFHSVFIYLNPHKFCRPSTW